MLSEHEPPREITAELRPEKRDRLLAALGEVIDHAEQQRLNARAKNKPDLADAIDRRLDPLYTLVDDAQRAPVEDGVVRLTTDAHGPTFRSDLAAAYAMVAPVPAARAMKRAHGESLTDLIQMVANWGDRV